MALHKTELQAALTLLSVSFSHNAGEENLSNKLIESLSLKLTELDVEYPVDADAETLLDLYKLQTSESIDELPEDEDFFEFQAKVGFKQPWQGGMFSKAKDEKFDCDDEKLITHLLSNALITRN